MPDVFTKSKRSAVMSAIRSRGNRGTELRLLALFREHGVTGWRRQLPLPGRPDFAFPKAKVAVFTDGCFWHGCPRCYQRPKSNQKFWDAKIARNRERDREVARELRSKGWRVIRIWEHSLKSKDAARALGRITKALQADKINRRVNPPPQQPRLCKSVLQERAE